MTTLAVSGVLAGGLAVSLEQYVVPVFTTDGNSRTQYSGNGVTKQFLIDFDYLDPSHVFVLLGGAIIGSQLWTWINPSTIQITTPPANGLLVEIRRVTPQTPLVTFTNGAVLPAADLNQATLQNLYLIQEINDQYINGLTNALTTVAGFGGPVAVTPAEMIAAVADQVLNSQLAISLNQRLNDIDNNAQAIINNAIAVDGINSIIDSLTGVGGVSAIVAAETTSRINGDTVLQEQLTLLGAINGLGTAFVLDVNHTYVDTVTSLATRLSGIDAATASASAAVVTESSARASGDTSNASATTALTATVAGNTASITTNATAISGLNAQYTVKVDVNGHVSGFGLATTLHNGTPLSSFIIQANDFAIIDPGNGLSTAKVPFAITSGVVYMQNVVINDAVIGTASINKLITGTLNADMNMGTGHITFDDGTHMMVEGVSFGSTSQFLLWYGSHLSSAGNFAACTEANATMYLKTNGASYFGGNVNFSTGNTTKRGYFKHIPDSNGRQYIDQWGYYTQSSSSPDTVLFNTTGGINFPTACLNVQVTNATTMQNCFITLNSLSATGFEWNFGVGGATIYWRAFGY